MMASAVRAFRERTGKRVALVYRPTLIDLLWSRLYDPSRSVLTDPIFTGNPDLFVTPVRARRSQVGNAANRLFQRVIEKFGLTGWLDRRLVRASHSLSRRKGYRLLYVDSSCFSYADGSQADRLIWKEAPNAIAGILSGFCPDERPWIRHPQQPGRFFTMAAEDARAKNILRDLGLIGKRFIVIEPNTNRDWFGDLRAWPLGHWQTLIDDLRVVHPDLPILRLGLGRTEVDGVIDLGGETTFREAAALIARSTLFIGTEGGLMHAAAAMDARAVIIWGGVTLPDFAGYPDRHVILFNALSCTHCGYLRQCPFDAACINGISAEFTIETVKEALTAYQPGIKAVKKESKRKLPRGAAA